VPGPDTVGKVKVIVHRDPEHLASGSAEAIAGIINDSQGPFTLGMAGGSTPIGSYQELRDLRVEWDRVEAYVSDERWVPLDHPDCNGHQASIELLAHVGATFHRPQWAPWLTAADSAAHYEAALRNLHPSGRSDLVLLGLGDDGHTASLFPGTAALEAPPERWFVHNFVPKLDSERLTATFTFLRAAHRVMFLVAGGGKAEALRQVLEPGPGQSPLPAARVMGGDADVTWLVDEAAASELTKTDTITA
jgi:6-phosphogluconolactonase